ncbi:hypothetical protein [Mycobacterium sp. C31M]
MSTLFCGIELARRIEHAEAADAERGAPTVVELGNLADPQILSSARNTISPMRG